MRKYIPLGGAISVVCSIAIVFLYLHAKRPVAASPPGLQHKLLSYNLSPYNLSPDDIEPLKAGALGGNCQAAKVLTRYYFDVLLDLYGGIKWVRVAAKNCPDVAPKMELGMMLVHYKSDPKVAAEVADLIVQIRKTNPAQADELQLEFER